MWDVEGRTWGLCEMSKMKSLSCLSSKVRSLSSARSDWLIARCQSQFGRQVNTVLSSASERERERVIVITRRQELPCPSRFSQDINQ